MKNMLLEGFSPFGAKNPTILVLGSFPSAASLSGHMYYAHPRNSFWRIITSLAGAHTVPEQIPEKLALLERTGIAVWDVYASCSRKGSLDSSIKEAAVNDIAGYLEANETVTIAACNGSLAFKTFLDITSHVFRLMPECAGNTVRGTDLLSQIRHAEIGKAIRMAFSTHAGREMDAVRLPSTSPIPSARFRTFEDKLKAWEILKQYIRQSSV